MCKYSTMWKLEWSNLMICVVKTVNTVMEYLKNLVKKENSWSEAQPIIKFSHENLILIKTVTLRKVRIYIYI